jgi:hypothetical protein
MGDCRESRPSGDDAVSLWEQHDLTTKVVEVLGDVHLNADEHPFGRPFITAYQLAIALQRRHPNTVQAIGKPVGGAGIGQHNSLAQYLANELSKQIRTRGTDHPVEGGFLSNEDARSMTFADANGEEITSSLVGTGFDLSLFRLR